MKVCSIFSQVLKLFSRGEFEKAVKEHKAERHARGFTSWGQFMAMLFCQLGRAHSLREICGGLACCEGQLKHLGVPVAPKKSTLAYANEHRPWELYQTVFEQTLCKCQELVQSQGGRTKFRFKNKLMSLDGSIIDLSVSMFDWAKFRRTKGAIKLHLLLDHDGYLPSFAVVSDGKTSEIKVARTLRFAPGTILAIDRGYIDYVWFRELTQEEVYFVTRMKDNAVYEVKEELQIPQNSNVVSDQIICFPRLAREGEEPVRVRDLWRCPLPESIDALEQQRSGILTQILELGDFRSGSITAIKGRCGKPNCRCHQPNQTGHGPNFRLTRKVDGKTVSESFSSATELRKAQREVEAFHRFRQLSQELLEVNEIICRARPVEDTLSPQEKKRPKRSAKKSRAK